MRLVGAAELYPLNRAAFRISIRVGGPIIQGSREGVSGIMYQLRRRGDGGAGIAFPDT